MTTMIKNDNMMKYAADRHPKFAPFAFFRRAA